MARKDQDEPLADAQPSESDVAAYQQDLQRRLARVDLLRGNVEVLSRNVEVLSHQQQQLLRARETLQSLMKPRDVKDELLIPIGGEHYIDATVAKVTHCMVPIGSGVRVRRPIATVLSDLDKTIGRIDEERTKQVEQLTTIERERAGLEQQLETEMALLQQSGAAPG